MTEIAHPFTVIVTVGPAMMDREKIRRVCERTPAIFRLNGAHLTPEDVRDVLRKLRSFHPDLTTLVDLPGAKIRTTNLTEFIPLRRGERFELKHRQVSHPDGLRGLAVGDDVCANDGLSRCRVVEVTAEGAVLESQVDGVLENNKGLHGRGIEYTGEYLSDRDVGLIDAAVAEGATYLGLSYVRDVEDIRAVEERLSGPEHPPQCIPKVETRAALANLSAILAYCPCVLIDRGDLASEVGLLDVLQAQREVTRQALARGCRVFCATQFLQSMVTNALPLIAEVEGIFHVIESGVHGIQLSAETAIGDHGLACIDLILEIAASCRDQRAGQGVSPAPMSAPFADPPRGRTVVPPRGDESARRAKFGADLMPNTRVNDGFTLWLTGLSGSGKTTIAQGLAEEFAKRGRPFELIDGDRVREFFGNDTDYTRSGRISNIKRIIFAAKLLSRNGVIALVANIAPYDEIRGFARRQIENYIQVYVKADLKTCLRRDPKGLYAKALAGEESSVVGLDQPYEVPRDSEVTVDTEILSVTESVRTIVECLESRGWLPEDSG